VLQVAFAISDARKLKSLDEETESRGSSRWSRFRTIAASEGCSKKLFDEDKAIANVHTFGSEMQVNDAESFHTSQNDTCAGNNYRKIQKHIQRVIMLPAPGAPRSPQLSHHSKGERKNASSKKQAYYCSYH
jgi:hypothetical protein